MCTAGVAWRRLWAHEVAAGVAAGVTKWLPLAPMRAALGSRRRERAAGSLRAGGEGEGDGW